MSAAGDVLISFESEVNNIRKQYGEDKYEVIVPPVDILAEFPVAWVDKNVERNGTEQAAKAYLNYLYSPAAQQVITSFYYRVYDQKAMAAAKGNSRTPNCSAWKTSSAAGRR